MAKVEAVITFRGADGRNVWINGETVALIQHSSDSDTRSLVTLISGDQLVLAHDPAEVARMVRGDSA